MFRGLGSEPDRFLFLASGNPLIGRNTQSYSDVSSFGRDLVFTIGFELVPRGWLPPHCN